MRVLVNKETCVVSTLCVHRVPRVFGQDEDGMAEARRPDPPPELWEAVAEAARDCPSRSIHLKDASAEEPS
ncbi:ferredoxin [Actinomadura sp. 9N407]|uniref:ferredoxin n=1 Tax=Actinomadura sp. 9N407 TaxID=3375154 RepID=UPI0037B4766B